MIQDRNSWDAAGIEGVRRFVLLRSVVLGVFAVIAYVAPRWGKPHGVDWGSALAWLAGGCLGGLVWALISWRMRERAFERNG